MRPGARSSWLWTVALLVPLVALSGEVQVPEPDGYWMGPASAAVPKTLQGGRVIDVHALAALLERERVLLIDVSNSPQRPAQLAPGAPWLPPLQPVIPGTVWIPEVGRGAIGAELERFYRDRLTEETGGDRAHPIVVYCHERCWLSWNAAKRAIELGYRRVHWLPEGIEGWRAAGFGTAVPIRKHQLEAVP